VPIDLRRIELGPGRAKWFVVLVLKFVYFKTSLTCSW
jgi:hypothetical protein